MKETKNSVGRLGEDFAADYLRRLGHDIVARNWTSGHLELDIVSRTGSALHIVEVKTREVPATVEPEVNFTLAKKSKLVRAAKAFINSDIVKAIPGAYNDDFEVFFDLVTVLLDGMDCQIEYYPKAFIPIHT